MGPQNWVALFKAEIAMIEMHLEHSEQFQQHLRAEIDGMGNSEQMRKWENGEVGNLGRLFSMMERTREILAQAREMSAWIVPENQDGLDKVLPGTNSSILDGEGANGGADPDSSEDADSMDTADQAEDAAPADSIPLNIAKKAHRLSNGAMDKDNKHTATGSTPLNPSFVSHTYHTPVNLNATSNQSKKRAKEDEGEDGKTAKKVKRDMEDAVVVLEPRPEPEEVSALLVKSKTSKVDFSAIETRIRADIEAGIKAKEKREIVRVQARLAKKERKRKRFSDGDSEKEVKKAKTEKGKKRKAEEHGDDEVLSDDESKKRHRVATSLC